MKLTPGRLIINRMKKCCWIFFREKGICKAGNCEDKILCYKTFLMLSFCLSNLSNKTDKTVAYSIKIYTHSS